MGITVCFTLTIILNARNLSAPAAASDFLQEVSGGYKIGELQEELFFTAFLSIRRCS